MISNNEEQKNPKPYFKIHLPRLAFQLFLFFFNKKKSDFDRIQVPVNAVPTIPFAFQQNHDRFIYIKSNGFVSNPSKSPSPRGRKRLRPKPSSKNTILSFGSTLI